jgi:ParB family chromosome partitioning protein
MGDVSAEATTTPERARTQRRVPIEYLRPNPRNPRRNFPDAELEELAASIKERGIIQPVVVRSVRGAKDAYEIIAGERRWRAAQRAALHEIPIVALEASDSEALELAIIRWKRAPAIRRWRVSTATATRTSPRSSVRVAVMSPTRCGC